MEFRCRSPSVPIAVSSAYRAFGVTLCPESMNATQLIELVPAVDLQRACDFLQCPEAGGIDLFVGTVRDNAKGKQVLNLQFEAYEPMALTELRKIADRAMERWPLHRVVIQHALGMKMVGEQVVITGVSASHRQAAFEGCQFLIDELKRSVPIWKHEFYSDSSIWVAAHP